MANKFFMVGKLRIQKDTEKTKGFEERLSDTGWVSQTLRLSCFADGSTHYLTSKGGYASDGQNEIRLYNEETKEPFTVKFNKRSTDPNVSKCASWNKFIVDLGSDKRSAYLAALKSGDPEELKALGFDNTAALEEEMKNLASKRKEFISAVDFIETVKKILANDKLKDRIYKISGIIRSGVYNGKAYHTLEPTSILLMPNGTEEYAEANIDFYYQDGAIEEHDEDDEFYKVNGYLSYYDRNGKAKTGFAPYELHVPIVKESENKNAFRANKSRKKYFSNYDDEFLTCFGVKIKLVNGAQKKAITFEDLDEDQQDAVICGDITLEEIAREMGGGIVGERMKANVFAGIKKGYSKGAQVTNYSIEDYFGDADDDDIDDIFDDVD